MNTSVSKMALRTGLLAYLLMVILLFARSASFLLLVICGAPGLVYGLTLIFSTRNPVSGLRRLFFVLFSMTINIACVYYVSREFLDVDVNRYMPFISVTCSTIAAVLLTIGYDFLVMRRFSVFCTIVLPAIIGIASSLVSAFCMHLLISGSNKEFVSYMGWAGMLSVFPLWQYLIGLNLDYHSRTVSKLT